MALTILDAGVVIAVIEQSDAHHDAAHRALDQARSRGPASSCRRRPTLR